jgi:ABC-type dipeptide/oligopeptide/nickel transport system permease subunit
MRFTRTRSAKVGLIAGGLVVLVAVIGPYFAPHSPSATVSFPFAGPSSQALLGTDVLGRDVLSRVLWGGRSVLVLAVTATLIAYAAGLTIGLVAGYLRSTVDEILMRAMDVLLAFPALLFLLIVATGVGHSKVALVLSVAIVHIPGIARIVRAATLEVAARTYVEAAVARGERTSALLRREILPNVLGPVFADAGIRLTSSILLIASVNFLGLGLQPPAADWALIISENRGGIMLQPWVIAVPALLLAILTISVNLVADAIARSMGVSTEGYQVTR